MSERVDGAVGRSLLLWTARRSDHPALRLICDHVEAAGVRGEQVITWPGCLAELPAAVPLELIAVGAASVRLDRSGCGADWPVAWEALAEFTGLSERLLVSDDPLVPAARSTRVKVLDAEQMPVLRRRSLFGLDASEPEPVRLPDLSVGLQQRLRNIVASFVAGLPGPVEPETPVDGWRWGPLDLVSEGCTACRVCVLACPEQALVLDVADQRATLGFDPGLCSGCGKCLKVCDVSALTGRGRLGPAGLLAEPRVLESFEVRTCRRCGAAHTGSGSYCPVCQFRVDNPFGSTLPPGAWIRPGAGSTTTSAPPAAGP